MLRIVLSQTGAGVPAMWLTIQPLRYLRSARRLVSIRDEDRPGSQYGLR